MLLLEQDITKNEKMNNDITELIAGNNSSEYKVEAICDSAVYTRKSNLGHLPRLYYLVFWENYLKKENTWEPYSAFQHLGKFISLFYKNYPDKPTAISKAISITLLMAKPIIKPAAKPTVRPMTLKQKQGRLLGNNTNKQAKKN